MNRIEKKRKERQIKKKLFLTNEALPTIEVETADETFDKVYGGEYAVSILFKYNSNDIVNLFESHGIKCREEK